MSSSTSLSTWLDAERGKLDKKQVVQLLAAAAPAKDDSTASASTKEDKGQATAAAPPGPATNSTSSPALSTLLSYAKSKADKDSERLVDMLPRTQQADLLHQLVKSACGPEDDLLVAAINSKCSSSIIKVLLDSPLYASEDRMQALKQGLTFPAAQQQAAQAAAAAAVAAAAPSRSAAAAPAALAAARRPAGMACLEAC